eukprot:6705393-Pyramimonas_sp.AAC.1
MAVSTSGGVVQCHSISAEAMDEDADARSLPVTWRNNARRRRSVEAVDLMQHHDYGDSPLDGEPPMLWHLEEIARSGEGGPVQRHYNWAYQLNAGGGDRS